MDYTVRLNKKLNRERAQRRRGLKGRASVVKGGIVFSDGLPSLDNCTAALAFDMNTNTLFANGDDMWYGVDKFEGTIPSINGVHMIFVNRGIMFKSLYYYNDTDKIHLSDYMEVIHNEDLKIDEQEGYLLYACYMEVG